MNLEEIPLPDKSGGKDGMEHIKEKSTSRPIKLIRTKLEQLKQQKSTQQTERSQQNITEKRVEKRKINIDHVFETVPLVIDEDEQSDETLENEASVTDVVDKLFKEFVTKKLQKQNAVSDCDLKTDNSSAVVSDHRDVRIVNTGVDGGKKSSKSLGLKISCTSAAFISSGQPAPDETRVNMEDGELSNSDEDDSESSDDDGGLYDGLDNPSDTGSIAENESKKKKKKKKHKHKTKKKKKNKDKDKTKERDKDKKRRSTSSKRSRSRSKSPKRRRHSRSPSGDSFFDKRQGIWRTRSRSRTPDRYDRGHSRDDRESERYRDYVDRRMEESEAKAFWGKEYFKVRRSRSRSRERGKDRARSQSREIDRHRSHYDGEFIDKERLRRIAITKAYANMKAGNGPTLNLKPDELACLKAGGKSIDELTKVCKDIQDKQAELDTSDEETNRPGSDDETGPFIHHPFKVNPTPNIVMNIRDARQLPVLTPAEKASQPGTLRLQFPVSSGSQHRAKEIEWVPVEKTTAKQAAATNQPSTVTVDTSSVAEADRVFPDAPAAPVDISNIISERLKAVRQLQTNPHDVEALGSMYHAEKKMNQWAQSKNLPGQFVGSTGAQVLSKQQLEGVHKKQQAWFKKDQFHNAAPVQGGVGMFLLRKMGWKDGEGLGKNSEGPAEPLMLEFKVDRKGLVSEGENFRGKASTRSAPPAARMKDLSGKHPVSALMEICNRRRWGSPNFIVVHESGPDHKKNFLFKVKVNNVEYQPSIASANKKQAKAEAATVCLQALGMVPK